jgi:hypothetical protein
MNIQLIKGNDLTQEQKTLLTFKGMKNPVWVECHSFYFVDGKPSTIAEYYFPVCNSFKFLPY